MTLFAAPTITWCEWTIWLSLLTIGIVYTFATRNKPGRKGNLLALIVLLLLTLALLAFDFLLQLFPQLKQQLKEALFPSAK